MGNWMPFIGELVRGLLKAFPFLAAYKAGGDAQKKRQAELAVKKAEKRIKIEAKNRKKSDAELLKKLDANERDD
jgi:hypothetical protein